MTVVQGIAASQGIAIAKAYILEEPNLSFEKSMIEDQETEVVRFTEALEKAKTELASIRDYAKLEMGADKAAIFEAHLLVLSDPELVGPIQDKIKTESVNAEFALQEVASFFITMFEQMDNEYMKERAADIRDVTKRVLAHLLGVNLPNLSMLSEEVIIVTEDLTPSDTAQLNRKFAKGFATNIGGRTSHSAIMARSMDLPAVVGTKTILSTVKHGDLVIVDGLTGEVHVNPTDDTVTAYKEKHAAFLKQKEGWSKLASEATVTADGHHVELAANIGSPADLDAVLEAGAEGVGLFRTEFLYMGRTSLPTEEEQFEVYKTVLERMSGKPVVVRTLDIGGDKELPYLHLEKEMNPFLGFRAIRLCLEEVDMFRVQLRALLRASVYGNLKVMFPMIATLDEFRSAKALLLEEKAKLQAENVAVSDDIEIGMMVEIPSSAVMADVFAKEVDFFSIGTNDLIQYTMAADRMNEHVSYLYQPFNPAILRLVKMVVDAANKEGIWAGMCGEMAGDPEAVPALIGLGLHELSMSATSILPARSLVKDLNKEQLAKLMPEVLTKATSEEIRTTLASIK